MTYARRGGVRRLSILITLAAGLMFLVGCSWGRGKAMPVEPPISIILTLSSSRSTFNSGQTVTVMAAVYDQTNKGVTWNISPLDFGSLSNKTPTSVTFTVPATFSAATTVTVTATSITNPNVTSSVQIAAAPTTISVGTFVGPGQSIVSQAAQTINQGEQLQVIATSNSNVVTPVTWSVSPASGAGSLTGVSQFSATYVAPAVVSAPTTATIIATAPGAETGSIQITVFPSGAGSNVAVVNVNGGPVPGRIHPNAAFTSVTICNPGSANDSTIPCQTVGGILVDTGSYGLRILQSEIPQLRLPKQVDGVGNTLENCAPPVDGSYLWGPVASADIYIAGELATSLVQIISSSNAAVPDSCSNGGTTNRNTPQLLGANGILGVGPEPTDCTISGINYCDGSVQSKPLNLYYRCPAIGCSLADSSIIVTKGEQVTNPIPLFGMDNNGVVLQFPPVSGAEFAVSGTMIFGIGTETNNELGSATVFTLDSNDHFTTTYHGQTLTRSFIDSGSNALYFPDSLPICTVNTEFFCPSTLTSLSAVNQGATQGQNTVGFSVDNADNLFSAYPTDAAFSTFAGPRGIYNSCSAGSSSCTFVWGLPFFYGRSVFTAIDGQSVTGNPRPPKPPWFAY